MKKVTYQKPTVLEPWKAGRGGTACFPRKSAVPQGRPGWVLTTCPVCGRECWETPLAREVMAKDPAVTGACTMCVLAEKHKGGGGHG